MGALLNGIDSDVWVAALPSITIGGSPDTCTDSGDHIVYWATHKAWDKDHTITVQCSPNGSSGWVTVTDYVFNWASGRITFNTARVVDTNDHVQITAGYYFTVSQLDECHAWSLSQKANIIDTTPFQAENGFKRKTLTNKDAEGSIETYRTDDALFLQLGSMTVLRLYVDKSANIAFDAIAWVIGIEPKGDANGVLEQTVNFACEGEVVMTTNI